MRWCRSYSLSHVRESRHLSAAFLSDLGWWTAIVLGLLANSLPSQCAESPSTRPKPARKAVGNDSTSNATRTDTSDLDEESSSSPANDVESSSTLPPPLTSYLGRPIAQTMHYFGAPWLVREERQREEDCTQMLRELRVRPGMVVCDMGCGNGFYTLPLAERVGRDGRILAVDIQSEMLRLMEARAAEADLSNIESILGTPVDPQLPAGQVDLILCVDVYHEFSHPEQMLAAMHRALRPDGQLVLVEFREEDPQVPIKPEHKMSKAQIVKEMSANQFHLVRQFDGLPWQHLMVFGLQPPPSTNP